MEHTIEASEARWIADPFIDQLRFDLTPGHMSIKGESWESRIPGTQGYWQALF